MGRGPHPSHEVPLAPQIQFAPAHFYSKSLPHYDKVVVVETISVDPPGALSRRPCAWE